jgi:pimeloyl-ACP methyl ester carboxylesterase
MTFSRLTLRIASLLRSGLRYGESKRSWKSFRQPGSKESTQAILMIGGLSSNAASTNRTLAKELSHGEVVTWSRNLYGHTGRYSDFSRSRLWHWIADGLLALRKLATRSKKNDAVLIGHSTGGLVVLAIIILHGLFPRRLKRKLQNVRLRGVLIFPPFRLQRRLDAWLLWIVAIMYYLLCPMAFLLLAFSGPWMWTLSLLAYASHVYFVPKISVPSGDERARQPEKKRKWAIVSESVFLAGICIYFVFAPPLIALFAGIFPGPVAIGAFALFIVTLSAPIFLIPRNVDVAAMDTADPSCHGGAIPELHVSLEHRLRHHLGYRWLPVITVANLQILQFILRRFLRYCHSPILLIEGGQDKVVVVEPEWIKALGTNVDFIRLENFPHSDLTPQQQTELAKIIRNWLAATDPVDQPLRRLCTDKLGTT